MDSISQKSYTRGLFTGMCTTDVVYYSAAFPKENKKIKVTDYRRYIGGPAANAAITYALLGGNATLATCLGTSLESEMMIRELNSYGVTVLNYSNQKQLPNTSCIVISPDGKRTIISGQHCFKKENEFPLEGYDFALFDCNQQEISLDILRQIGKIPVILDAGSWKTNMDLFLQKADIVIASEDFKDNAGHNLLELSECHAKHKVITRGEKPVLYEAGEIEVPQVEAVDTLGAGDIFHGAFCFAYYEQKMPVKESLAFAVRIAAESVKYRGPREWVHDRAV